MAQTAVAVGCGRYPRPGMTTIALVLSAGGTPARAFHAGALAGLAESTGWDARDASLIVGTSAGALAAAMLRTGLSPADELARFCGRPLSPEGEAIVGRIRSTVPPWLEYSEGDGPASAGPDRLSVPLALRGLVSSRGVRPGLVLAGLSRRSHWSNHRLGDRVRDVHDGDWPHAPTWVCAVRVRDGRRVVFGRDDVAHPDLGTAVQASSAVPHSVAPVRIGKDDYIDGAMASTTNADLVAPLAFDAVVVVSSMTAVASASRCTERHPTRSWMSRVLAREVTAIRSTGTPVLVIQPTAADLAQRDGFPHDPGAVRAIAEQARNTAAGALVRPDAARVAAVLAGAARTPAR